MEDIEYDNEIISNNFIFFIYNFYTIKGRLYNYIKKMTDKNKKAKFIAYIEYLDTYIYINDDISFQLLLHQYNLNFSVFEEKINSFFGKNWWNGKMDEIENIIKDFHCFYEKFTTLMRYEKRKLWNTDST